MDVKLYYPANPVLKKYISYFYLLEHEYSNNEVTYLGFPTYNVFATILNNADIIISEENSEITESRNSQISSVLFFDDKKSGSLKYSGKISEITICFKPLGINAFLSKKFSHYKESTITPFYPFDDFKDQMAIIFSVSDVTKRVQLLETYLLSKVKGFKHPFLKEIILDIMDESAVHCSISDIAKKYNISRPTLNKHFKDHIGTNPNQFIKIVRFRNAIKKFTSKTPKDNLVDVAYLTEYFDQSHMIKDFISLTGYTPKAFFSKLTQLENGQINWLFL